MAQDRKVFVGGVPQDLNQDDLYAIFSEYSVVKKAWLQSCRSTDAGCPAQNHRGFGFVIFHDSHAINELLGGSPSRFVVLRNGAKLEVKRALSSNKIGGPVTNQDGAASTNRECRDLVENLHKIASKEWKSGLGKDATAVLKQLESGKGGCGQPAVSRAHTEEHSARQLSLPLRDPVMGRNSQEHMGQHCKQSIGHRQRTNLRDAVVRFYQEHWPEKLDQSNFIDFICLVYEGRDVELDEALRKKYGSGLPGKWNSSIPNSSLDPPHRSGPSDLHVAAPEITSRAAMAQRSEWMKTAIW